MAAHPLRSETIILPDPQRLAVRVAEFIVELASHTIDFRVALAGGSTPRPLYELLASDVFRDRIAWQHMDIFFGDERCVPHDDPRSNYRMASETLLARVPPDRIRPIPTDGTPEDCARRYEATLKDFYGSSTLDPARPLFDLVLLGLGSDGHTASLFPGDPALGEEKSWVAAVHREEPRITLTFPVLQASATTIFLVTGADKAAALSAARAGDPAIPAGRLRPHGALFWFADSAAAGET